MKEGGKEKIKGFLSRLKHPRWYVPLLGLVLILAWTVYSMNKDPFADLETKKVERTTVAQSIVQTGTVEPATKVDLTAERGGRITGVYVKEGDTVKNGAVLVRTDSRLASADVASARTRLATEESRLAEMVAGGSPTDRTVAAAGELSASATIQNAVQNLENIKRIQKELVESAWRNLVSTGLTAYLVEGGREDRDQVYQPPTISGVYESTETGNYTIELYGATNDSGWAFTYTGLENGRGVVSTTNPQPLGTRGLYIQFPQNFATRGTVRWYIPIPNDRSLSYVSLNQAYEQAKLNRDSAILAAEQALTNARLGKLQTTAQNANIIIGPRQERIDQQRLAVTQARTALWQAQIGLSQTALTAPFNGTVTGINAVSGQMASGPLVSLMSDAQFKIVVDVAETDVTSIKVGDAATVSFDAYRGESFEAKVVSINPAATDRNGIKTFKTTLQILSTDPRILAGLTADIEIHAAQRKDVLAVPTRAIFEKDDAMYVRVRTANGEVQERSVTIGLKGSDGTTEITSGLTEGDEVVTFLTDKQLELLKKEESKADDQENKNEN